MTAPTSQLTVAGLSALRRQLTSPAEGLRFQPPVGLDPDAVAQERASINARYSEQQAKLASLSQQMAEKRVEAVEDTGTIAKLKAELPMLGGVREMYEGLYAQNLATKIDLLSSTQRFSDAAHDYVIQTAHRGEAETGLASLQKQYEAQQATYARDLMQDLTEAQQKLAENEAAFQSASHDVADSVLRAPVAGTVQQLAVHSSRGVVTPGQKLLVIVPDANRLVVEAMVANRDIGFVRAGQQVQVKVAAFKFTQYGLIPGHIVSVSRDAVDDTPSMTRLRTPRTRQPAARNQQGRMRPATSNLTSMVARAAATSRRSRWIAARFRRATP